MTKFLYITISTYVDMLQGLHTTATLNAFPAAQRAAAQWNRTPLLYIFRNNVNGRLYIGATWDPFIRWYNHIVSGKDSNIALQRALAKYGRENFTLYVHSIVPLPVGLTRSERAELMLNAEHALIEQFDGKQLYNFDTSGRGNPRAYGTGNTTAWSPEQRLAKSEAMKGTVPINKGVPLSEANKAKWLVGNLPRYFPLGIFDDMGNMVTWYPSFNAAMMSENAGRSHLSQCLKHNKLWKGWHVRYLARNVKQ